MVQVVLTKEQLDSIKDLAVAFNVFSEAVAKKGAIENFVEGINGIEEKLSQKAAIQAEIEALTPSLQELQAKKDELEKIAIDIANYNREFKQLEFDVLEKREQKLVLDEDIKTANNIMQVREAAVVERETAVVEREKVCGDIEIENKDLKEQLKAYQDKEARVKAAIGE